MSYTQLTQEQRYQIHALMKAGHNQMEIARVLGVHKSTISRECRRNRGLRGYRPAQAHRLALSRRAGRFHRRIDADTWALVDELLREDWSPEQISLWLARTGAGRISHEWIYQHVLNDKRKGGELHRHLRCQKRRRKRYGNYERRGQLINRISIDERPAVVEQRSRLGDWEADTIIGKGHRHALVSLTERRSRLTLLAKVARKKADQVAEAIVHLLRPYTDQAHTITADNGKEFALHELIAHALGSDVYFAHPYSSWERGTNENANGLVRQYFPKHCDFTMIEEEQVIEVMDKLNNRPRKCLGMRTPNEVFFGLHSPVALTG